jgi:hypothetical protein
MRLLGWLGVVSVGAVLLLTGAEGADDKRLIPADAEVKALSQKVAALEARLRILEAVVQVTGNNVKLVADQGLTIQAGSNLAIRSSATLGISSSGTVGISGSGAVEVRGSTVHLNTGGRPLARMGDPVMVDGKAGQITGGSPTILAQ